MSAFFSKIGDFLTIKTKKKEYRPSMSILAVLSLIAFVVFLAYMIFCTVTHGSAVDPKNATEHAIIEGFGWASVASFLILSCDLIWRRNASHVLFTFLIAVAQGGYCLAQGIYRVTSKSDITSVIFFIMAFVFALWSALFFVKKALDGDASWLMKTVIGLTICWMVAAWFFAYQILEAFGHVNDALFWDGVIVGISTTVAFIYAANASLTSDFDPHPIAVDELGNIIEEDASAGDKAQ